MTEYFCNEITDLMNKLAMKSKAIDEKLGVHSELMKQMLMVYLPHIKAEDEFDVKVMVSALDANMILIHEFRNQLRSHKFSDYFSAFAEATHVFYWHRAADPNKYISLCMIAVDKFTDKIYRERPTTDQIMWMKYLKSFLLEFQMFAQRCCTIPDTTIANPEPRPSTSSSGTITHCERRRSSRRQPQTIWLIENKKNMRMVKIERGDANTKVFISNCENSNFKITKRVGSVFMEKSSNCRLELEAVNKQAKFDKCLAITFNVIEVVKNVFLENTKGWKMYLGDDSMEVEIISRNSSDISLMVRNEEGVYTEHPVKDTLKTGYVSGEGIVTNLIFGSDTNNDDDKKIDIDDDDDEDDDED